MGKTIVYGAALAAALFSTSTARAQDGDAAPTRAVCEATYRPSSGQGGKDVIWVPTPGELVAEMLAMAKVTPRDTVVDLGAGDGRIAIAAGKLGARAIGIEYNPKMVQLARCLAEAEGVADRTQIVQGDIFKQDFSEADVVTMYLLADLNLCIRHRLLAMKPGTRVVSHAFSMGDWQPDQTAQVEHRNAYLWIVPARVAGTWSLQEKDGPLRAVLKLRQEFQKVGGEVIVGDTSAPVRNALLRGDELQFAFDDEKGVRRTFSGTVRGGELRGTLTAHGNGAPAVVESEGARTGGSAASAGPEAADPTSELTGTLDAQDTGTEGASWRQMAPQCGSYYARSGS